jgi:hypothetical protein
MTYTKQWTIEAHGDVRELYTVDADTEEEAREKYERGDVGQPYLSETMGTEIVRVTQDDA